ncbi:MAG: hypothetical protein HQ448_10170 [Cytophagales bacterium]|nr:hypothetical protein [Cytophagales bacterium]
MKNPSDKDWKSMESEWREKIHEEIYPVPEGLWEKLSARLDAEEKPKVFFVKTWQWVAILAVAIGLGWQWFLPRKEEVAQKSKSTMKAPILAALQIQKEHRLKNIPAEKIEVTSVIMNSPEKGSVSLEPKTEIDEPTKQHVVVQQSPPPPSNLAEEKVAEEEDVIWVQVKIDPVLPADEERPTLTANPTQKKRNLGQWLKKIKQVIKGNPGEWSEIKENFHLVANKYVQTEETIKQKIQFQ